MIPEKESLSPCDWSKIKEKQCVNMMTTVQGFRVRHTQGDSYVTHTVI